MLNHLLLIICLCIVIALILYFFYWNRFMGFVLGQIIRLLYWNQDASSIWVEIGSIHFSLLAGRILLKDVRYHSSNQTINIIKGQIQWRYWIRKPTSKEEVNASLTGDEGSPKDRALSCRVHISFQGFEWFMYNRTAAYDSIISQMAAQGNPRPPLHTTVSRQTASRFPLAGTLRAPLLLQRAFAWIRRELPTLDPKDLFPLGIEVTKGAIICGNASTPNLLMAEFKKTLGTFGIVQSRSRHDLYKQVLSLKFQDAVIRYVENEHYVDTMTMMGDLIHTRVHQNPQLAEGVSYLSYKAFAKIWRQLKLYMLTEKYQATRQFAANQYNLPKARVHTKSKKKHDDTTHIGEDWSTYEYAIEREILRAPILEVSYYVDVAGLVPPLPHQIIHSAVESVDVGNGDVAPEWGVDLVVRSGFIRYGPWADRQRAELQRVFFPPTYQNSQTTPHLHPGDRRLWTAMRVFVELRDDTTVNIPFREASKNWQWDGEVDFPQRPRVREPASIHVTAGDCSSINYIMSMVAGPGGYEPTLEVHLDILTITSSLNDMRLIAAESCRVRGEMPSPLKWDADRKWLFSIFLRQPNIYLLRDHINMFTDLAKDWASGPPSDFQRWIPTVYSVELDLHHFDLHLYANDHNIIDRPLIDDENVLFTLRGARLKNTVEIPSNTFRPESTTIGISVEAPDVYLDLSLPRWNTHAFHSPEGGNNIGRVGAFKLRGSYEYFSEVGRDRVEQLKLDLVARNLRFKALGWSIRYFMVLRDNYLGSFTHFSTLQEYLEKSRKDLPPGDPIELKYREGKANILQVELLLNVQNSVLILPAGLPGNEKVFDQEATGNIGSSLVLTVPEIQLHLRLHEFFMEMTLNIDPISGHIELAYPEKLRYAREHPQAGREPLFIDGIDITANRLFGPQPRTATYLCIWEIRVGRVGCSLSTLEGKLIAAAGNTFRLNYVDAPNAPAAEHMPHVDPDITFVKVTLASLDVVWRVGETAVSLSLPLGLYIASNDLAGKLYRKVTSVKVPCIDAKLLLTGTSEHVPWLAAAEIHADAFLDIYACPHGWRDSARAQAAFVDQQDAPTRRAEQLFERLQALKSEGRSRHKGGLYLPQPMVSVPRKPPTEAMMDEATRAWGQPRKLWRISSIVGVSESEDDSASEADRDARLALTRSSTPLPPQSPDEDERNMSGNDESDDGDLTDQSSDSHWSENEHWAEDPALSPFLPYFRFVEHFFAQNLNYPTSWTGSPFTMAKANASYDHEPIVTPKPSTCKIPAKPETDGVTTYRISSQRPVTIKITPLVLASAATLIETLSRRLLSPELYLDSLIVSCLGKSGSESAKPSSVILDVRVPSFSATLLQHIPAIKESTTPLGAESLADLDVLMNLVTTLEDIAFIGQFSGRAPCFSISLGRLSTNLSPLTDKRYLTASHRDATVACELHNLQLSFSNGNLDFTGQDGDLQVGHLGPPHLLAVVGVLNRHILEIKQTLQKWDVATSSFDRRILADILERSEGKTIVDPLSTIQPSYLVQVGVPRQLRADPLFRFLFHLRHSLWDLTKEERATLGGGGPQDDRLRSVATKAIFEARLLALDLDWPDTDHIPALTSLSPERPTPATRDEGPRGHLLPKTVSLRVKKFFVSIPNASATQLFSNQNSDLTITDLAVNARFQSLNTIQYPFSDLGSMSQTSLRNKPTPSIQKTLLALSVGSVEVNVLPHLMVFTQHLLRAMRGDRPKGVGQRSSEKAVKSKAEPHSLDFTASLSRVRVRAAAENLVFDLGATDVQTIFSCLTRSGSRPEMSVNSSIIFGELFLRARSPADPSRETDHDVLASLDLTSGKANLLVREPPSQPRTTRVVFSLGSFIFNVPRSALRLYRFAEEWRASFLPGIEQTVQEIFSELQTTPISPTPPSPLRLARQQPVVALHVHISQFKISLQVLRGTWLSWEVYETVAFMETAGASTSAAYRYGIQMGSQALSVSSAQGVSDTGTSTRLKVVLPAVSVTGQYETSCLHVLALVEFVEFKVKPYHWDTLLAVQQKFGQDFNDLMVLIQETNQKRSTPTLKRSPQPDSLKYVGFLKIRGFRVGLEGRTSTLNLECLDVGGGIDVSATKEWHITMSDLSLSLIPRVTAGRRFHRRHRSAFVIVDFKITAGLATSESPTRNRLQLSVTKIHAVMQPSSIGEVGDFIDQLRAEMLERQEQRALEMEAFKEKTRTILQTFEVKVQESRFDKQPSWVKSHVIDVSIRNIGVAFPLALDPDLEHHGSGTSELVPVRAFLFAIKSVEFGTHYGETGQALMKSLSFQFVPRFRQSMSNDFAGESHQTRNRLVYPEMKAQLRTTLSATNRNIWIRADVSGFILDLDSNIPDYVFSLVDVYRQGRARVEQLAVGTPRTPSATEQSFDVFGEKGKDKDKERTTLPGSNIYASLVFLSGKVRTYSESASTMFRSRSFSHSLHEPSDDQVLELGAEVFNLPMVSVWTEYRTSGSPSSSGSEPSSLAFKSTVHSSQNTLRPTLLPFLTELIKHVETRLKKVPATPIASPSLNMMSSPSFLASHPIPRTEKKAALQISFSLRIDKSKLELTCQPDVNVVAGLNWDSGGFILNISPGARTVVLSGSVGGLTIGLKHGFLSEDCVKLDARNLTFNLAFAKMNAGMGRIVSTVSAVLDTEFLGMVRFSRLQDILCFKAVWLDRIPVFAQLPTSDAPNTPSTPAGNTSVGGPKILTVILARVRQVKLEVDLGQSISNVTLALTEIGFRTRLSDESNEVSLSVADLSVNAAGNMAGYAHVPDFVFQTIRRTGKRPVADYDGYRMLELRMTSGALIAMLESENQQLLHYRAEPLEVEIFDDWSKTVVPTTNSNQPLQLSFTITSPEIVVIGTVGTIPKLLLYVNKFRSNLAAQREGASRESLAFRVTRQPKPDNPLSAVAEAMLHSARSRFSEADSGLSHIIKQHMSLRLDLLRIIIFPRTVNDPEVAHFIAREVRARLDRLIEADDLPAKRSARLAFSSMMVSRFSQLGHSPPSAGLSGDGRSWLLAILKGSSEATIFGLPSMTMHMVSEESQISPMSSNLVYDFHSEFIRQEGMRDYEDIYITLNVSLYSWLTILRKTLTREMDQIKAASDSRSPPNPIAIPGRRKVGESTSAVRSSSVPIPISPSTSAGSPTRLAAEQPTGTNADLQITTATSTTGSEAVKMHETSTKSTKQNGTTYAPRRRHIERLTMRQLGEATPDVMHPFFMKKAGFNLEDSLPQYVHEYATRPLEEIMEVLLKLYSKQLLHGHNPT